MTTQDVYEKRELLKNLFENIRSKARPNPIRHIKRAFGKKYQNIQEADELNKEAGTRNCFLATTGSREILIKKDKEREQILSSNAKKHSDSDCNTKRASRISYKFDIEEALTNNVSPIIDHDADYIYSVEPYFKNSESLRRTVDENGALNFKDFKKVFSGVLKAENYLLSNGVLHRDLNSRNILIRRGSKGDLETRIVDFANACEGQEVKGGQLQTMGSRDIADPLAFNGQVKYNEQSEMYALAADMVFSLTGTYPTRYEFLENPEVDSKKHNAIIEKALEKFPKRAKKLKKVIRKATSINSKDRYKSFEKFNNAFNKACKPTLWERVKGNWGKAATITTLLGAVIAGNVYSVAVNSRNQALEQKVSQGEYIDIKTEHNGSTMEIENNLFSLDYQILNEDYKDAVKGKKDSKYIQTKPGQKFEIDPQLMPLPLPSNVADLRYIDHLRGRAFLEGVAGTEVTFVPKMSFKDMTDFEGDAWVGTGMFYDQFKFAIPSNLPNGNYMLNLEIWGENPEIEYQIKDREKHRKNGRDVIHYNENQVISRTEIPVTVGNHENLVSPRTERIRILNDLKVHFYNTKDMVGKLNDFSYEAYLLDNQGRKELDVNLSGARNVDYVSVSLPEDKEKGYKAQVELIPKHNNERLGIFTFPVESLGDRIYEISDSTNRPRNINPNKD